MTTYETDVNHWKMPLWECIMIWHPWVGEADAKRIATEALEKTMSVPLKNHQMKRRWCIVKHINDEAMRLKRDQEGA